MKPKLYAWTACLLIHFSIFSQSISGNTDAWHETGDTLYSITAAQLRETCRIFTEHSFLKSENELLNSQISFLNRSATAKDYIIQSQREQIGALNDISVKKDAALTNCDAMIENLKKQVSKERQEQKKYFLYGAGAGIVLSAALVLVFR